MCDFDDDKPMYLRDLTKDEQSIIFKYRLGDEKTRKKITDAVFSDDDSENNDDKTTLQLIAKEKP